MSASAFRSTAAAVAASTASTSVIQAGNADGSATTPAAIPAVLMKSRRDVVMSVTSYKDGIEKWRDDLTQRAGNCQQFLFRHNYFRSASPKAKPRLLLSPGAK